MNNNVAAQPLPMARVAPAEAEVRPHDNMVAFNVRDEIVLLHKTQAKLDTSLKCFAVFSVLGFCLLQCFTLAIVTLGFGSVGAALYFKM